MIIWPEYFNKNLSLSEGRKIPKEIAIKNPTINEITNALRKLKIQFTVEKDKSYPGKWYEHNGRIIVETDKNKLELLEEIAQKM
ncbi:signal recognition particle subunit SRP19/SEC65 family protein [Methanobrevibacter sp. OttesenSCG-928-I08]|nr:signal recognition particle subunit SRP19/SEC65 family protein [Methanobrevibacter sp. OttesenSCG-928-I08]